MVVNVETFSSDILEYARDALKSDSALLTILDVGNPVNYFFATRPTNQRSGFPNPRLVVEVPSKSPGNIGDNPDGYENSTVSFQISGWVDNTSWSLASRTQERIEKIFQNVSFQPYKASSASGNGKFTVTGSDSFDDPDKENTRQVVVLITAELTVEGD